VSLEASNGSILEKREDEPHTWIGKATTTLLQISMILSYACIILWSI
jgi:hypothetical protein